jgi:hypothetical protein
MIPQEFEFVTTALPTELVNALRRVSDAIVGEMSGENEEAPGAPYYVIQVHRWGVEPDDTGRIQVRWHYSDAELQRKANELERSNSPFSNRAGAFRQLVAIEMTIHPTSSKGTCLVEVLVPLEWRVVVDYWHALRDGLGELYPEFRPGYVAPGAPARRVYANSGAPRRPEYDKGYKHWKAGRFTNRAKQEALATWWQERGGVEPNADERERLERAFRRALDYRRVNDKDTDSY